MTLIGKCDAEIECNGEKMELPPERWSKFNVELMK